MAKQRTINIVYKVDKKQIDQGTASVNKAKQATDNLEKSIDKTGKQGSYSFGLLKNAISAISFTALLYGLSQVAKKVFELGVAQEQTNIAFETFLGSAEKARKVIADLTKFSIVTPFTPDQVFKSAKALLAFGVEADKLIPTLKQLGDVSAGTGKDLTEMAIIFGQIRSTGKLMGQDLLQLINAGFNPLQVISQKTGKSVGDLKKEMEKGLITFEMVDDAFKSATSEGGLFFDLMQKQSESIGGLLSTIQGNTEEIGKALFATNKGPVADLAQGIADLTSNVEFFADAINRAIKANGIYWLVKGIQALKDDLQGSEEAQRAWGMALLEQQKQLLNTNQTLEQRRKTMADIVFLETQLGIFNPATTEDPLPWATEEKGASIEVATKKIEGLKDAMKFLADEIEEVNIDIKDGLFDDNAFLTGSEQAFKEAEKLIVDGLKDQYDREFDLLIDKGEKELAEIQAQNDRKKQLQQAYTSFAIDSIQQVLSANLDAGMVDMEAIRNKYSEEQQLAGDNEQAKKQLRYLEEQETIKAERKNKEIQKRASLRKIAIDTAAGIARAVSESPLTFGLPFSAFVATTGLIQSLNVRKYKKGAIDIDGPGTTTSDSIPAMLSKHESVMTAEETMKAKGILKDIRAKKLDDKVINRLYAKAKGGDGVVFDDERIVKELKANRPKDHVAIGSYLYEIRKKNEHSKSYILSKYLG